jgi:C-terminal processing protease CtpA/Prc
MTRLFLVLLTLAVTLTPTRAFPAPKKASLREVVLRDVEKRFPDQALLRAPAWKKAKASLPGDAKSPFDTLPLELQQHALNELLGHLASPPTILLSEADEAFYAWKELVATKPPAPTFRDVGASFERLGAKWFVSYVYEGSPAFGKLLAGDEVVSTSHGGMEPFAALQLDSTSATISFDIRRTPQDKPQTVVLTPRRESFWARQTRETIQSSRVIPVCSRQIAYLRLSALRQGPPMEALKDSLTKFEKSSDAMLLDIRKSFAGGTPGRSLEWLTLASDEVLYRKPLFILIDKDTSGPLEALAFLLQSRKRATLVGTPSAGALAPVDVIPISGTDVNFLLVVTSSLAPEEARAIQGKGLVPNRRLEATFVYQAGHDQLFQDALRVAAECPAKPGK